MRIVVASVFFLGAAAMVACQQKRPHLGRPDGGAVVTVAPQPARDSSGKLVIPGRDEKEPNNDLAHADRVDVALAIHGNLATSSDIDIFSIVVPPELFRDAGAASFVEARITIDESPGIDIEAEIVDARGQRLVAIDDNALGEGEVLPNLAVLSGETYYIRVHERRRDGRDSKLQDRPTSASYRLRVGLTPALPGAEAEPNNDRAHATPVGLSPPLNGFLTHRRDEDWFKLDLTSGGKPPDDAMMRIELSAVAEIAMELRVVTDAGTVLAESRTARGAELRLRNVGLPSRPDFVWIVVRAREGHGGERYSARITLEPQLEGAEREPNGDIARASEIKLPGNRTVISGFFWPGDVDVYRVVGPAGAFITAEVEGDDHLDLKLERLDRDGAVLMRADDDSEGHAEILPPSASLTSDAFFRVTTRLRDTAFDTPYRLTLAVIPPEDGWEREPNDTFTAATRWKLGAPVMRGHCAPKGDQDLYRLDVPLGMSKLHAHVDEGKNPSFELALLDDRGLTLERRGATADLRVTAGHTYYVRLSCGTMSRPRDPYSLSVELE